MATEPKYYAEVIKKPQSFSENTTGRPRETQPSGLFFLVRFQKIRKGNLQEIAPLRNLTGETFELTVYASGCAVSAASTLVQKGPVRRASTQGRGNPGVWETKRRPLGNDLVESNREFGRSFLEAKKQKAKGLIFESKHHRKIVNVMWRTCKFFRALFGTLLKN